LGEQPTPPASDKIRVLCSCCTVALVRVDHDLNPGSTNAFRTGMALSRMVLLFCISIVAKPVLHPTTEEEDTLGCLPIQTQYIPVAPAVCCSIWTPRAQVASGQGKAGCWPCFVPPQALTTLSEPIPWSSTRLSFFSSGVQHAVLQPKECAKLKSTPRLSRSTVR